jgi:hypothetical protein
VMSNHYHVVLHIRPDIAQSLTELEVVKRWHQCFNGTLLSQRFLNGEPLSESQWKALRKEIKFFLSTPVLLFCFLADFGRVGSKAKLYSMIKHCFPAWPT